MFERYTESARKAIFFARYEASQFGSPYIETEHLLLGLVRSDFARIKIWLPTLNPVALRTEIEDKSLKLAPASTSIDLPLSGESTRVLKCASSEADSVNDPRIGTEHLLLGLMLEEGSFAARLLRQLRAQPAELRIQIANKPIFSWDPGKTYGLHARPLRSRIEDTIEIHGSPWNVDYVREIVVRLRQSTWHWHKSLWKPRDIVRARKGGAISFDLSLAEDSQNFELVIAGWKKDHCVICRWELVDAPDDVTHGVGYTNGRDWLCIECFEKFWGRPEFFAWAHPEIT